VKFTRQVSNVSRTRVPLSPEVRSARFHGSSLVANAERLKRRRFRPIASSAVDPCRDLREISISISIHRIPRIRDGAKSRPRASERSILPRYFDLLQGDFLVARLLSRDLLPAVCVACRNTASLHPTVSISNFILKCSGTGAGSHREKKRGRERERDSSLICAEPRIISSPSTCEGKLR
jgi:hypothetical protein